MAHLGRWKIYTAEILPHYFVSAPVLFFSNSCYLAHLQNYAIPDESIEILMADQELMGQEL